MLTALFIASFSLSFKGGTAADLVKAFEKDTKEKIVIPADIYSLPSFYIEYDKPEERNESFCRKVSLEEVKGLKNVFAPNTLPSSYLENYSHFMPSEDQALNADSKSCLESKDGKWRLKLSPNGYLKMADLETLKLSKTVKVHWLVKTMFVAGDSDWLYEKDLLQALASCSFGSVKETEKQYEVDLDPVRFRKAAVVWAKAFARLSKDRRYYNYFEELKWTVTAEAFIQCTDAQIKTMTATPETEFNLTVPRGSLLDRLADEVLRVQFLPRPEELAGRTNILSFDFSQLHPTRPRKIEFKPKRCCSVWYWYKDNGALSL